MTIRSPSLSLLALLLGSCIALVDRDTEQCKKDSDCVRESEVFRGTVCTADKVCGRESCKTNADCAGHFGEGGYCRPTDATCVDMLNESCSELVLPKTISFTRDEAVLVGFMAPLRAEESGSYGTPLKQGAAMALEEIDTSPAALPAIAPSARPRYLAMLVCHDGAEEKAEQVARHLVEEVGVSAVIGPAFSGPTRRVVNNVMKPGGALSISPSATSPEFAEWLDDGFFWRTVPSDTFQAPALAALVQEVTRLLRSRDGHPAEWRPSVALVWIDSGWGKGIKKPVETVLSTQEIDLSFVEYAEPSEDPAVAPVDWPKVAAAIAEAKPDIVVALGTNEFPRDLLPQIEQRTADKPPVYVVPEGSRVSELSDEVKRRPSLSARILGTAPGARQSPAYSAFESTFIGKFGVSEAGNLAEFAYDAVYLLAFAIARTQQAQPTGRELVAALSDMTCTASGRRTLSALDYVESTRLATRDPCVNFEGASGPVDFDVKGEVVGGSSDMQLWCPTVKNGKVALSRLRNVYYNAQDRALDGSSDIAFCD
jgi:ABC-type branched-subunit amino acid transport system substrate-binding protein